MTDDNVTYFPGQSGAIPSRKARSGDLRNLRSVPADLADDDALERLGLGLGIPNPDSVRVSMRTLRELGARASSAAISAGEAERHLLRAATMSHLAAVEMDTLARRIAELLGDEDPPKGAA